VAIPLRGSAQSQGQNLKLTLLDNPYLSAMAFTAKSQVKRYPIGIYCYLAALKPTLDWPLLAFSW
jgi:hypothetical protein